MYGQFFLLCRLDRILPGSAGFMSPSQSKVHLKLGLLHRKEGYRPGCVGRSTPTA